MAVDQVKKLNRTRRRAELALKDTVERMTNLGASMTASLNKKEPKTRFATSYKQLLKTVKEQLDLIEQQLGETEELLDKQQQEKKRQELSNAKEENQSR